MNRGSDFADFAMIRVESRGWVFRDSAFADDDSDGLLGYVHQQDEWFEAIWVCHPTGCQLFGSLEPAIHAAVERYAGRRDRGNTRDCTTESTSPPSRAGDWTSVDSSPYRLRQEAWQVGRGIRNACVLSACAWVTLGTAVASLAAFT